MQRKVAEAECKLNEEHEEKMKVKMLLIEQLELELAAVTTKVDEAIQNNADDGMQEQHQLPMEEPQDQIKAEVQEKHHERVAKEVEDTLDKQTRLIKDLTLKLKKREEELELKQEELVQKHKAESRKQREEAREQVKKLELKYQAELDAARKHHTRSSDTMVLGQDNGRADMQKERDETLVKITEENNELSQQLQSVTTELKKLRGEKTRVQDSEFVFMQQLQEKTKELEETKTTLTTKVDLLDQVQNELVHLQDKYQQLEVQAQAKQELSGTFIPSDGDVSFLFCTVKLCTSNLIQRVSIAYGY